MNTNTSVKHLLSLFLLCMPFWGVAQLPVAQFQPGKATLTARIKNYNPEKDLNIRISIPNLIMISSDAFFIDPDADGTFTQSLPLKYTTQVCLKVGEKEQFILMSPEGASHVEIDIDAADKAGQFVYTGQYAQINNDLNGKLKTGNYTFSESIMSRVLEMTPREYRDYYLADMKQVIAENNAIGACPEATQLANIMYAFDIVDNIKSCKWVTFYATMQKDSTLTRPQALTQFKDFQFPEGYYDFLPQIPYNAPEALLCFNFSRNIPFPNDFDLREAHFSFEQYLLDHASMLQEERDQLEDFRDKQFNGQEYPQGLELMKIMMKYDSILEIKRGEDLDKCKIWLAQLFGSSETPLAELMELRSARIRFFLDQKPLRAEQESHLKETLRNPFFISLLEEANEGMKPRKSVAHTGSILCDNPEVTPDKILDTLIDTYKGKIIFIDCWATWCTGCRKTIQEYEPLKQSFGDKVAFVYLTDETSPLDPWKKTIADISGYHYRLGKEQWGYIWERFKLIGLPFYLVINEKGEIVHQFVHVTKKEVQDMLDEAVKQSGQPNSDSISDSK